MYQLNLVEYDEEISKLTSLTFAVPLEDAWSFSLNLDYLKF